MRGWGQPFAVKLPESLPDRQFRNRSWYPVALFHRGLIESDERIVAADLDFMLARRVGVLCDGRQCDPLRGGIAIMAMAGAAAATVSLAPTELDQLIAVYTAAVERLESAPDDEVDAACDAEGKALDALLAYRPADLGEVRRRSDFMLATVPQVEDLMERHWLALLKSTAGAGVA